MSRLALALLVFLLALTALAQPGLCPCWLLADADKFHPHPAGNSHQPHGHSYLYDLFQAQTAAAAPARVIPFALILLLLLANPAWLAQCLRVPVTAGWRALTEPPPPRLSTSFLPAAHD